MENKKQSTPQVEKVTSVKRAIELLTVEALRQGTDANDTSGVIRALVSAHALGFEAWFCVCCEVADRKAQAAGFKDQVDQAIQSPGFQKALGKYHETQKRSGDWR